MSAINVIDIGYLKKKINSVASGVKSVTKKDYKTITFETNDGNKFDITVSAGVEKVEYDTTTSILKITYANGTTSDIDLSSSISDTKEIDITTPSTTWSLQHNLNTPWYELYVLIIDSDNNRTYGNVDVDNCTDNVFMLKFDEPISGKAIVKK